MKFNLDKYLFLNYLYFGRTNKARAFRINGKFLGSIEEHTLYRVHVQRHLKVAAQVDKWVKVHFNTSLRWLDTIQKLRGYGDNIKH